VIRLLRGEVWLLNGTTDWFIWPSGNSEEIMHSTVRAAVRISDESRFADWSIRRDERRNGISRRHGQSTGKLGIGRGTTSAQDRLNVATAARIQIETRAEPISNAFHLRELRHPVIGEKIQFTWCKTGNGRARARRTASGTGIGLRETARCG
jgi:hypothetical protein